MVWEVLTASIFTEAASLCLVSNVLRTQKGGSIPSVMVIAVNVQDFLALHT
jgi:hypothetical protein